MTKGGWQDVLLNIMIAFLLFLLLSVVIFVVLLISFPQLGQQFRGRSGSAVRNVLGPEFPDLFNQRIVLVRERAAEGYTFRIIPAVKVGYDPFRRFMSQREQLADERKSAEQSEGCLPCHDDVFKNTALEHIYYDHQLHHEREIFCLTCHSKTPIRKAQEGQGRRHVTVPIGPTEELCVGCHKRVEATIECAGCHPPGSVNTEETYDPERRALFLKDLSPTAVPDGFEHGDSDVCFSCHVEERLCQGCHAVEHPPGWDTKHARVSQPGVWSADVQQQFSNCLACHKGNWCSTLCHRNKGVRNPPGNPVPPYPLPRD